MATPQYESSNNIVQTASQTDVTVIIPDGTAGDLVLLMLAVGGSHAGDIDITDSIGGDWVELDVGEITDKKVTLGVYGRRTTGLDDGGSSVTGSWSDPETAIATVVRYSDVDELNTIRGLATATEKSETPTAPNVVSGLDGVRVLRLYAAESGVPSAFPSGMDNEIFHGTTGSAKGDVSFGLADEVRDTGDTDEALFSIASKEHWRGMTLVLASAPVTSTPPGVNPLPADDSNNAFPVCSSSGIDGDVMDSGVLNSYFPGTLSVSAGSTAISLGAGSGAGGTIGDGDLLLVMQMQDAVINSSDTGDYGDGANSSAGSVDIHQTGLYEFVIAESFVAGILTVERGLAHDYNAGGNSSFQVVRVPRYDNLTLNGTLTGLPWDGSVGGVLVVDIESALNLGGHSIDMSGLGFRAGLDNGGSSTDESATVDNRVRVATAGDDDWAEKGEGIAGTSAVSYGGSGYPSGDMARGAPGNGGGGGNDHNGGGGGGSNLGYGGRGGFGWSNGLESGGFGGGRFDGYSGRLLMGGGGGAGNANGSTAGRGAPGAGIVIINAKEIDGTGEIVAQGFTAPDSEDSGAPGNDGTGGGGAGGTIVIRSLEPVPNTVSVKVNGGAGGNVITAAPHGPGGGGGAGVIYSNVSLQGAVEIFGGAAGIFFDSDFVPAANSGTHGADAGEAGEVGSLTQFPTPVGCDFPDEPASYSGFDTFHLITATGGSITPLSMGPLVDFEPKFIASANADADDLNQTSLTAAGDDEDGVEFHYPAVDTLAADVTVFNPFQVDVTVCAWLDFDENGVYDGATEGSCQDTDLSTTTLTFSWSGLGDIETFARFRISSREPLSAAFPNLLALDGEIESHKVIFPPKEDYGDAPLSYGVATHYTVEPVYLGTIPPDDEDATLSPAVSADGDDNDNISDEESFVPADLVTVSLSMSALATVTLSNELTGTLDAAQLVGWIDFDGDNVFDNDCGGLPTDVDGDGLYVYPNYCERSLPMLTELSGDIINVVISGFADAQTNVGVEDPAEALGIADGSVAGMAQSGDVLTLDLTDTVEEGQTLTVWANGPKPISLDHADTVEESNGVTNPENATGAPDGAVAELRRDDNITLQLSPDKKLGSGQKFYLRASGRQGASCLTGVATIEVSSDNSNFIDSGTLVVSDCILKGYELISSLADVEYIRIARTSGAVHLDALSYLTLSGSGPGEATIEVSPDGSAYSSLGTLSEPDSTIESIEFTVPAGGARFVRFTWTSETVGVDAVGYGYTRVELCDLNATYGGANAVDDTFTTGNIPADCGAATAGLMWTNIDNGSGVAPTGATNARFRLTTDSSFFADASPDPASLVVDGEVEDYLLNLIPTAITLSKVGLEAVDVTAFLDGLNAGAMSREQLLGLLAVWDEAAAFELAQADSPEIRHALISYLDPDQDDSVAVLSWETLEERGTIGFFVERRLGMGQWQRINKDLLPGLITAPMGGEYQLADPSARSGQLYQYRLIELEARGTLRTYGPFEIKIH